MKLYYCLLGFKQPLHELIKGLYFRVCKGSVELCFNDEASVEALLRERLRVILSQFLSDEFEELLVTLDSEIVRKRENLQC